jgi:hypothetical protein
MTPEINRPRQNLAAHRGRTPPGGCCR